MSIPFPSSSWVDALSDVLNQDPRYAEVASRWEGDILVLIDPDESLPSQTAPIAIYLDLWHGRCRSVRYYDPLPADAPDPAFTFKTQMKNILQIFSGDLDPIQAMLTRRLRVEGNMAYLLRNVPTVLDFIRCCRLVPLNLLNYDEADTADRSA